MAPSHLRQFGIVAVRHACLAAERFERNRRFAGRRLARGGVLLMLLELCRKRFVLGELCLVP
jgi:hypothetical protein